MQRPNLESFAACMIMIHHRSVLVDPKGCGLSDILSLSVCLSLSLSARSIYCTLFSTGLHDNNNTIQVICANPLCGSCMLFSHTGLKPSVNTVQSLASRLESKRVKEPSRVRGCALAGDAAARDLGVGATSVWCESHNLSFLFFSRLFFI